MIRARRGPSRGKIRTSSGGGRSIRHVPGSGGGGAKSGGCAVVILLALALSSVGAVIAERLIT